MTALTKAELWERVYGISYKPYPDRSCRSDRELMALMGPVLSNNRGGSIVELGCGNSYWLPYFAKRYGMAIHGIDFSLHRLLAAEYILYNSELRADLIHGDCLDVPRSWGEKFDVVVSFGVAEHFDPMATAIETFSRYLKPGGTMITTVPHLNGVWGKLDRIASGGSGYVKTGLDEVVKAHSDAKLEVVAARYFRWLDASVINTAMVPAILRIPVSGAVLAANRLLAPVTSAGLPGSLYPDMFVVSRKVAH